MTSPQPLPIVFLPGTLCDARMWHYQQEEFPLSTVVDLRSQSTVKEMLQSIREVPYEHFILAGFSLGGYIAQEFSLSDPERVKHLVLMGSSAQKYPAHEKELAIMARTYIAKGLFKGITDKRMREFLHPDSYAKAEIRDLIHAMSGSDAGEVYLRQTNATLERPELLQELDEKLQCPLSAIAGRDDKIVASADILKLEQVKNSEVYVLDNCGHFMPLEKPLEVNAILKSILEKI